jgi:hypothetical protein
LEIERAAATAQIIPKAEPAAKESALLVSTLALPRYEALFPKRWPETARKVLPSDSPGTSGTAVWGPVLAWSLLHGLPLDGVSMFDQLRLRHALADIFHGLGMGGDDGWRAAARVRFLLHRAGPLSSELSHREWQDGDVRWLTGTHTSQGVRYFNQESYEELLWWIQVPALVAASPAEQRAAAQRTAIGVDRGTQAAKDAGYRLDILLGGNSKSIRTNETPHAATPAARKAPKAGVAKTSGKVKSNESQDGAGAAAAQEKSSTGKAKTTKKKSTPKKK